MLVKDALIEATKCIKDVSRIPNKEARILMSYYLKKDQLWLTINDDSHIEKDGYFKLVRRREKNEPIEYITNSVSFYSNNFFVDSRVLIPRPETELLVDLAVSTCRAIKKPKIVEIGTGSGIISIMIAKLLKNTSIWALDISKDALSVAEKNAKEHGVNIGLVHSDLFENFQIDNFDLLVSNPPYIADDEPLHVGLSYEPKCALFGGILGSEVLYKIIDLYMCKNIKYLLCEIGYNQKIGVEDYLRNKNVKLEFYNDLAGKNRGFILSRDKPK